MVVYGFDSIRPDLRELLVHIAPQAARVTVILLMDQETAPDGRIFAEQRRSADALESALYETGIRTERRWIRENRPEQGEALNRLDRHLFAEEELPWEGKTGREITLFAAANPTEETVEIMETLRGWHEEGIAWNRMAIALPGKGGPNAAMLARLKMNRIPFFCAEKTAAASHGVCRMLTGALACISEGYQTDAVMAVARSGFTSLTEEEAGKLDHYAHAHGISRNMWQVRFSRGGDADAMEEIRQRLISPIEEMREELKRARNAAESVEAVVHFLEAENVWDRLREREKHLLELELYREAVVDRQIWRLLMEILDQLWTLLGKRRASIREMKSMLEAALDTADIAVLPER